MNETGNETEKYLRTSHRLAMFNVVIWFVAGALQINGRTTPVVLYIGFAYALFCMFYYYHQIRRRVWSKEL